LPLGLERARQRLRLDDLAEVGLHGAGVVVAPLQVRQGLLQHVAACRSGDGERNEDDGDTRQHVRTATVLHGTAQAPFAIVVPTSRVRSAADLTSGPGTGERDVAAVAAGHDRHRCRVVVEIEGADGEAHLVVARDPERERYRPGVVIVARPLEPVAGLQAERRGESLQPGMPVVDGLEKWRDGVAWPDHVDVDRRRVLVAVRAEQDDVHGERRRPACLRAPVATGRDENARRPELERARMVRDRPWTRCDQVNGAVDPERLLGAVDVVEVQQDDLVRPEREPNARREPDYRVWRLHAGEDGAEGLPDARPSW